MFARVEKNQVIEWPIMSLSDRYPNTSFPSPVKDSDLPPGYVVVAASAPPEPGNAQKVVSAAPVFEGLGWRQGWSIVDLSDEDIAERAAANAAAAQSRRADAYRMESDPIFFKAQRGEATMQDWLAKVAEIKARHPD